MTQSVQSSIFDRRHGVITSTSIPVPCAVPDIDFGPVPSLGFYDHQTTNSGPGIAWAPFANRALVVPTDDEVSSHALIGGGGKVRVIPAGESWPVREVKSILKDG